MTEPKTQYESMVDEQKQNEDICKKYNLYFSGSGYISDVFNVIKKLEIDIFNLRESLKLSQELNTSYEKTNKEQKELIKKYRTALEFYADKGKYTIKDWDAGDAIPDILQDRGGHAREALK